MLAWMGRLLQRWGLEGWLRGVGYRKFRRASFKLLQREPRMLLGMALERWGCKVLRFGIELGFGLGCKAPGRCTIRLMYGLCPQTQWLAERSGFEMQVDLASCVNASDFWCTVSYSKLKANWLVHTKGLSRSSLWSWKPSGSPGSSSGHKKRRPCC